MSRFDLTVASVAALASVAAAMMLSQDSSGLEQPVAESESVPVAAQTLACPESPAGPRQSGTVLAAAPREQGGGGGAVRLTEVENGARDLASSDRPGVPAQVKRDTALPAIAVEARGSFAPGVGAVTYIESVAAERSGLEGLRCEPAQDEWWFPGIDTTAEARSELVLVNPTPAVAVVTLHFHGPDGAVRGSGAQGIPVGAHTSQVIDLAGYAPGLESAAVRVEVTRGRVTPAVHVQHFSVAGSLGADWIPSATQPATELVVDPTPTGTGERSLVITNPGSGEALVQGRVLDEDGSFDPQQLQDIRVAPGSSVEIDLTRLLTKKESAAGVRMTSNVPVLAGVQTRTTGGGQSDIAFSSASSGLVDPVAVPTPRSADVTLVLASVREAGAPVEVAWFDDAGAELGSQTVRVAGSRVSVWQPPQRSGRPAYVVVTPPGGREPGLHGVLEVQTDAGVTTLPLSEERVTLTRPALQPAEP